MSAKIKDQVEAVIDTLENPPEFNYNDEPYTAYDYLEEALDIQYIVNSDRSYRGARVLVCFGGPNVWVDTERMMVDGTWWMDTYSATFTDELGLDEALQVLWECC